MKIVERAKQFDSTSSATTYAAILLPMGASMAKENPTGT
jgi:hypothetical protein